LEINDKAAELAFSSIASTIRNAKDGRTPNEAELAKTLKLEALWTEERRRGDPIGKALLSDRDRAALMVVEALALPKPLTSIDDSKAKMWATQLDRMFRFSWGCRLCKWGVSAILSSLGAASVAVICGLWPPACAIATWIIRLLEAGPTGQAAKQICKKLKRC